MSENQNTEWKESWRDDYLKWVCGFANASGGKLMIGKNDQGKVVGIANARELLEILPNKVRDVLGMMVDVNLRKSSGKNFLEIIVKACPNPISYKGEYFYRSGSTNQALKGSALDAFLLRKYGKCWDDVPMPGLRSTDFSLSALKSFRTKASNSGRMNSLILKDGKDALLENLKLKENTYFKRAAALLFSHNSERFINGAYIKIGFFITDDDLRYQDEVHGNLFEQVEKTLELLHSKYLKAYITYHGIQRIEKFLYPYEALREAILNAVIHKDYSSSIPIQISVYEDKLIIWNEGQMPQGWSLKNFLGKHASKPANPLVANAFFRAGYIESWGRGIEKINQECQKYHIPNPHYNFEMSGLMITFHANPEHIAAAGTQVDSRTKSSVKTLVKTPVKTPVKILQLLEESPDITLSAVALSIGKSLSAVERASAKLVKEGRLRHVGPQKGGHWEVL